MIIFSNYPFVLLDYVIYCQREGCSYSYDLESVAGLYEKKKKNDSKNNDLQVGCFVL